MMCMGEAVSAGGDLPDRRVASVESLLKLRAGDFAAAPEGHDLVVLLLGHQVAALVLERARRPHGGRLVDLLDVLRVLFEQVLDRPHHLGGVVLANRSSWTSVTGMEWEHGNAELMSCTTFRSQQLGQ